MNKKIITLLIIALFSLSMVWAENNTTEDMEIEDMADYIIPTSINKEFIEFSDGFIGFCLDGGDLTTSDRFTQEPTNDEDALQNYIKLAIIECYKLSKEDSIPDIVTSFCDGSYLNSEKEVIKTVLDSNEIIGDTAVVDIDNDTEATFNFELLKATKDDQSDCIAYNVSIKTVKTDEVLGASGGESQIAEDTSSDDSKDTTSEDASKETKTNDDSKSNDDEPVVNETNKTIVNKTNTVIVHEKNTTVITKNNVKNDTPEDTLLKTAGNPLFILVIVIAIIAVVAFEKHRRG